MDGTKRDAGLCPTFHETIHHTEAIMRKPAVLAVALFLLTGCASSPSGGQGLDPDRISRMELQEAGPSSAYNAIHKLRPIWLRKRGNTSFTQDSDVLVYLDGTRVGEKEVLRGMSTVNIERMEFMDARRATNRFGPGHVNGAILLISRGLGELSPAP
jgi:hypothetical protein